MCIFVILLCAINSTSRNNECARNARVEKIKDKIEKLTGMQIFSNQLFFFFFQAKSSCERKGRHY